MPNFVFSNKLFLIIFFVLFTTINGNAQSISSATVNSTGNTFSQNDIVFDWSVGELALVETQFSATAIITNGMLQPIVPAHYISDVLEVYPNNILSSNGDGKNDVWVIKEIERYPDNELTVFDRGGRVVYKAKNYQNNWSGDISGLPLSQDTYYYILRLTKDGKSTIKKGFITILN